MKYESVRWVQEGVLNPGLQHDAGPIGTLELGPNYVTFKGGIAAKLGLAGSVLSAFRILPQPAVFNLSVFAAVRQVAADRIEIEDQNQIVTLSFSESEGVSAEQAARDLAQGIEVCKSKHSQ